MTAKRIVMTARSYALAVALVAAAALARWALGHFLGVTAPFVTFYPAVILAVLIGGTGPAVLAIILSALTVAFSFFQPVGSFEMENVPDIAALAVFCLCGVFLAIIASRLTSARVSRARLESEARFRSLFENNLDGIIIFDPESGDVIGVNPSALSMLGTTEQELRRVGRAGILVRDAAFMKAMEERSRLGRWRGELTFARRDGSTFPVEVCSNLFTGPDGRTISSWSWRDITDRRQMEDALRQSLDGLELRVKERTAELSAAYEKLKEETEMRERTERQLRQAHKMEAVGTLAGGIAHDFNNMLAVIIGNAEMALDDVANDPGPAEQMRQILKASSRARDLVKQILAYSRKSEAGKVLTRMGPLVRETFGLLRGTLPSTIRMDLQVETDMDAVMADPSQIQQIFMNLAMNAAYAMRNEGGVLSLRIADEFLLPHMLPDPEMSPGRYVRLTVQDTGTGMTEEVVSRAFDPFFTTKEVGQGAGMGLAVAYGIVKSHNGAITVESEPGKGATFSVFLPFAEEQPTDEHQEMGDVCGGRERILLVDDEPTVVEATGLALRRLGYTVILAGSGPEALEMFERDPYGFDLVITDQVMPDLTGIDLARRMMKTRGDVPVILFTGYSETVSAETARDAGVRDFVMKPVTKREMAQTIRCVLDSRNEGG